MPSLSTRDKWEAPPSNTTDMIVFSCVPFPLMCLSVRRSCVAAAAAAEFPSRADVALAGTCPRDDDETKGGKEKKREQRLFYNERFLIRSSHKQLQRRRISNRHRFLFLLLLLLLGRENLERTRTKKFSNYKTQFDSTPTSGWKNRSPC